MTRYEILLFLHIAFVILWIGAGFLFHLLGYRADRADNQAAMKTILDEQAALATIFFIPSSLLVLVFGILLTVDGPWSFGDLWIVLGLAGFALTFLTGILWIKPQSERTQALTERDGGMSPEAVFVARRMTTFARLDMAVLFLVVLDMVRQADARRRRHARLHGCCPRRRHRVLRLARPLARLAGSGPRLNREKGRLAGGPSESVLWGAA